jgi:AAA family ATP:ADP antiporter
MRLVLSSPYLRAIAAVICLASFVTTLTGWQFKAVAKQFLVSKDALAILFGNFYFYAGILGLLFQLLLTTRFLRRFGIGTMLFVLPAAVMGGSAGLMIWGTLASALVLKGSDQVLRYSLDKSAVELLYLPLPHTLKLRAKWFIDTVVWRLGDGLAGVTVLIFATYLHVTARHMSWIALVLIGAWFISVSVAGRHYIGPLRLHWIAPRRTSWPARSLHPIRKKFSTRSASSKSSVSALLTPSFADSWTIARPKFAKKQSPFSPPSVTSPCSHPSNSC